jgi:hypothetical protein
MPPSSEPLEDIFAFEGEIADGLGAERSRAARWLEETKRAVDEVTQRDIARLKETIAQNESEAQEGATRKAAAIVAQTKSSCERLAHLDDGYLKSLICQRIASTLPGAKS